MPARLMITYPPYFNLFFVIFTDRQTELQLGQPTRQERHGGKKGEIRIQGEPQKKSSGKYKKARLAFMTYVIRTYIDHAGLFPRLPTTKTGYTSTSEEFKMCVWTHNKRKSLQGYDLNI